MGRFPKSIDIDKNKIQITYECPLTKTEVTTSDYSISGGSHEGDYYSVTWADLDILQCPACGREHEAHFGY